MRSKLGLLFVMTLLVALSACQEAPRSGVFIDLGATTTDDTSTDDTTTDPVRPDGAIYFVNDFCACNNTKPVIISGTSCTTYCASKNTNSVDTLYFNFTVGDEIISQGLEDTYGWCTTPISDSDNPSCYLEAKSTTGTEPAITVDLKKGNAFSANISSLSYDKTYILTLVEQSSGARSSSIQIRKISEDTSTPLGPLWVQPVSQYTCMNIELAKDENSNLLYESATRLHYYFIERNRPDPIPSGVSNVYCHDISTYGKTDKSTYPRLEETAGSFATWSSEDIRFYDRDSSGKLDVNETIYNKIKAYGYNISAVENYFMPVQYTPGPSITDLNINPTLITVGYIMTYFYDSTGNYAFCPTQAHYNSTDARLKAIGDVVQVDTEGFYYGCRETLTYTDVEGTLQTLPGDILTLREGDLKKAWFYIDATTKQPTQPTTVAALRNNTIKFYYPFDFTSPYVKKSNQFEYTIRDGTYVTSGRCDPRGTTTSSTDTTSTTSSNPTAHDKRLGCIPKSSN